MKLRSYRYKHENHVPEQWKQNPSNRFQSQYIAKPKAQPKIENAAEAQTSPPVNLTQEVSNQILKPPQLPPYEVARQSYTQMKEELRQKNIEKANRF